MPKWLKIILIILSVGLLFLIIAGFGAYFWITSNADEYKKQHEQIKTEAQRFARDRSQADCLAYSVQRLDDCSAMNVFCEVKVSLFMSACFEASTPTSGFCHGVPKKSDIMKSVTFRLSRCEALGRPGDQACTRVLESLQDFCHEDRDGQTDSGSSGIRRPSIVYLAHEPPEGAASPNIPAHAGDCPSTAFSALGRSFIEP